VCVCVCVCVYIYIYSSSRQESKQYVMCKLLQQSTVIDFFASSAFTD